MTMTPFNPQDLHARLADMIKGTLAELIPEEAYQAIVAQETKKFLNDTLPKLVQEELTRLAREQIRDELKKPEYHETLWNGRYSRPGEVVQEMTRQLAPDMVSALFEQLIVMSISRMRQEASRGY